MRKQGIIIAIVILVVVGVVLAIVARQNKTIDTNLYNDDIRPAPVVEYGIKTDDVELVTPIGNGTVASPLAIQGRARGTWFFEASFPAQVLDQDGTVLGVGIMTAEGEWMTTEFVEFSGQIVFSQPSGTTGTLLLQKDNPSGLPENDEQIRVPIFFAPVKSTFEKPSGVCKPGVAC